MTVIRAFMIIGSVFLFDGHATPSDLAKATLGEWNPPGYVGPSLPQIEKDTHNRTVEIFSKGEKYFRTSESFELWMRPFVQQLQQAFTCPSEILEEYYLDFRQAYRLLTLSYIFEGSLLVHQEMKKIGWNDYCVMSPSILEKCRPQSSQMKNDLNAIKHQFKHFFSSNTQPINTVKAREEWFRQSQSDKLTNFSRLLKRSGYFNLENAAEKNEWQNLLPRKVKSLCQSWQESFQDICSEKDSLFGVQKNPLLTYMINSSILFQDTPFPEVVTSCLHQFSFFHRELERVSLELDSLFPFVRDELMQTQNPLKWGRLFSWASLQTFKVKGLKNVVSPQTPLVYLQPVKPRPLPPRLPPASRQEIIKEKTTPEKQEASSEEILNQKNELRREQLSAFQIARKKLLEQKLSRSPVDMIKFRFDHIFSMVELDYFQQALGEYTSRIALEEMKKYDKLGSSEGCLPLSFLKFLLDAQNHQALFNLQGVIGKNFWVENDLDEEGKKNCDFLELDFQTQSNQGWQLILLTP
jgi:hypothetical protein